VAERERRPLEHAREWKGNVRCGCGSRPLALSPPAAREPVRGDHLESRHRTRHRVRAGLELDRVRTLTAGALILDGIRERLGVSLRVVRGDVREGALLELESRRVAA
jgi:hypothetical protein